MTPSPITTSRLRLLDEYSPEQIIRRRERLLLVLAGLFLALAHTGMILARGYGLFDYWHLAVWAGCAIVGHLVLTRHLPRRDPILFPVVMILTGWGMTLIDRLTPFFAMRQTIWLIVSTVALI